MGMLKISKLLAYSAITSGICFGSAAAAEIDTNMAQMQAMDKITGKVSVINVPVDGEVVFGSFSIVIRACKTRPPEETPENFAFVDIADNYKNEEPVNIFRGWMMSSTPALNAVEHPIYDVWLLKCYNGANKNAKMLSKEELDKRNFIPKVNTEATENKSDITKPAAPQNIIPPIVEEKERKLIKMNEKGVDENATAKIVVPEADKKETDLKVLEPAVELTLPQSAAEFMPQDDEGAPKSLLNIAEPKAPLESALVTEDEKTGLSAPSEKEIFIDNEEINIDAPTADLVNADEILEQTSDGFPVIDEPQAEENDLGSEEQDFSYQLINLDENEVAEEGFELNDEVLKE